MAHYAELDNNNIVLRVIPGVEETEKDGEAIYQQVSGKVWKRTSYNTRDGIHLNGGIPFRKNYASIGYTYDSTRDAFIPPKPFSSWSLNEFKCNWEAPVALPNDDKLYTWNEEDQQWNLVTN
jgi:hypothetical protein